MKSPVGASLPAIGDFTMGVKVETFTFAKCGVVPGVELSISNDAALNERRE